VSEPATGVSGRPLSRKGEQTRKRLLEAAEQVFADLGYHDASIVKITEAAGIGQGTFYLYFRGKKEIFDELVLDLNHRVRRAIAEATAGAGSRLEQEILGFRAFFRFTAEHPALYRIIRQAEFVSPDMLHRHYELLSDGYVAGLRRAIEENQVHDGDPEVLAWALMGMGELIGMRWILWEERDALPPHVAEHFERIIRRALDGGGS
jgi:AcrR family transcriptional regulator